MIYVTNVDFQYMSSTRTWNPLSGNPTCWILGENLYCSFSHIRLGNMPMDNQ